MEQEFSLSGLRDKYTELMSTQAYDNFLKGDIAIEVYNQYNKEKETKGRSKIISKFLAETGESKSSFDVHKWVSTAFQKESIRKLPGVTWSHYRACAASDTAEEWILRAHDESWSCKTLRDHMEEHNDNKEIESGVTCYSCGKSIDMTALVTVSLKRKRSLFCSPECASGFLSVKPTDEIDDLAKQYGG